MALKFSCLSHPLFAVLLKASWLGCWDTPHFYMINRKPKSADRYWCNAQCVTHSQVLNDWSFGLAAGLTYQEKVSVLDEWINLTKRPGQTLSKGIKYAHQHLSFFFIYCCLLFLFIYCFVCSYQCFIIFLLSEGAKLKQIFQWRCMCSVVVSWTPWVNVFDGWLSWLWQTRVDFDSLC